MMINKELQQKYWDLFVNREDVYAVQQDDFEYARIRQKLTPEILFNDDITIGLYQLNTQNKIKWAVVDFDIDKKTAKDDPNFDFTKWEPKLKEQVIFAKKILDDKGVPNYIEFSGFRGYHIWIFFSEAVDAGVVKDWMEDLFKDLQKVDRVFSWELFPKQEAIALGSSNKGLGSLVKVPLQIHKRSGKQTYFVDENFNAIDALPQIELLDVSKTNLSSGIKIKRAPKSFQARTNLGAGPEAVAVYPTPESITKMIKNCALLSRMVDRAEKQNHLLHEERIVIANLGRFFGKEGKDWVHKVISNCSDYDPNATDYYISKLTNNPIKCSTIKGYSKNKNANPNLCANCKNTWASPISFGYTKIQQHYAASQELSKSIPELFTKLNLLCSSEQNFFVVTFNGNEYKINKHNTLWFNKFNLVDFVRFVRPDDWQSFLHTNYPKVIVDKFALEYTDKTLSEIFNYNGEEITFNQFLSEAKTSVEKVLTDDNNYNFIAFTGGGKTEALIKEIKAKKIKAIFLSPYESNCKQLANKYSIPGVHGDVSLKEVKNFLAKDKLVVSTYDGLRKILDGQILPEEYILLIDEAHNLITHADFRMQAISKIINNLQNFKKVINITGTPEGVLNNDYKNIRFVKAVQNSIVKEYQIIKTNDKTNEVCVDLIIKNKHKGKVVIFKNSTKSLEIIKEGLIENGVSKNQIKILHSSVKDQSLYVSIVEEEVIPQTVKYILTTSVISDGVNIINKNIDSVYLLECSNLLLLRQFIARFRKGIKNIYDIIPESKPEWKSKGWFDFTIELERMIRTYEDLAVQKTKFLETSGLIKNYANTNIIYNATGGLDKQLKQLYVDVTNEKVVVNKQLLTSELLNDFHNIAYFNSSKRKEYLDHFLKVNCLIKDIQSSTNLSQARDKVSETAKMKKEQLLKLLNQNAPLTVTSYLTKLDPVLLKNLKSKLTDLVDEQLGTEAFYTSNKKLLKLKDSAKLIKKYIQFYKLGFPNNFIVDVLAKDENEILEFELNYYTQLNMYLVNKHEKLLKYNKKSLSVFYYAVFKYIYDRFTNNKKFTHDDLLHEINGKLIADKIIDKKIKKEIFTALVNRMIEKKRLNKRVGKKVKNIGWEMVRFKNTLDLAKGDTGVQKIIDEAFKKMLQGKLKFMEMNLFLKNLDDRPAINQSDLRNLLTEIKSGLVGVTSNEK